MASKKKCDRCGELYEQRGIPEFKIEKNVARTKGSLFWISTIDYDLCPTCHSKLADFLLNK